MEVDKLYRYDSKHNMTTHTLNDILNSMCAFNNNELYINYSSFKKIANADTYNYIINIFNVAMEKSIIENNTITVHMDMKGLTIVELDKHKNFIFTFSKLLQDKYPNKLEKCFIYNAPSIFIHVYNILKVCIDKNTLSKLIVVK
jgi:hypothetical protein